ncbi:MAG: hypothetical protein ACXIUO_14470 [Erythrobacter sp.]
MLTPSLDELEQSEVPDHHKLVIAECVIEWARAESQLRALLTALQGKPLDSGAADYNKLSPDEAWRKIKGELLKIGAPSEFIEKIQKKSGSKQRALSSKKIHRPQRYGGLVEN